MTFVFTIFCGASIQGVPSKSDDFQKFNFKMTARALPVIPPKFTQPEKIILM
jgi:hypothetical protein